MITNKESDDGSSGKDKKEDPDPIPTQPNPTSSSTTKKKPPPQGGGGGEPSRRSSTSSGNNKPPSTGGRYRDSMKWKTYTNGLPFAQRPVILQVVEAADSATGTDLNEASSRHTTTTATVNHSYRDFSKVPPWAGYPGRLHQRPVPELSFCQKLHVILDRSDDDSSSFADCIAWMPHGRCFGVTVPKTFERTVCPVYFGHSRYSKFVRDLQRHGFKHLTTGVDRNCT